MTACCLVSGYQGFGETRCFSLQDNITVYMETADFSEIIAAEYYTKRYYNPQDHKLDLDCRHADFNSCKI
jgi:hypothetical protein